MPLSLHSDPYLNQINSHQSFLYFSIAATSKSTVILTATITWVSLLLGHFKPMIHTFFIIKKTVLCVLYVPNVHVLVSKQSLSNLAHLTWGEREANISPFPLGEGGTSYNQCKNIFQVNISDYLNKNLL